ncbi:ATP-binding cassette domain-containing protein [Mycoplasma sp. NEAQ87857]|uniref:ABC transporter ATP-binding protein n=1 Tax=Mycoplasma sp. NEAQ87857 TaxID=2683967 RepID=UPI0013166613|nr:ABC transporter ATP-binding protein [Mycoplasma sp. NEAQ87857]QGZ97294.1 ATP-binding cassette domain-containing protein [Mycoplasma sp. NEAQ87857]
MNYYLKKFLKLYHLSIPLLLVATFNALVAALQLFLLNQFLISWNTASVNNDFLIWIVLYLCSFIIIIFSNTLEEYVAYSVITKYKNILTLEWYKTILQKHQKSLNKVGKDKILNLFHTDAFNVAVNTAQFLLIVSSIVSIAGTLIIYGTIAPKVMGIIFIVSLIILPIKIYLVVRAIPKQKVKESKIAEKWMGKVIAFTQVQNVFLNNNKTVYFDHLYQEQTSPIVKMYNKVVMKTKLFGEGSKFLNKFAFIITFVVSLVLYVKGYVDLSVLIVLVINFATYVGYLDALINNYMFINTVKEFDNKAKEFFSELFDKKALAFDHFDQLSIQNLNFNYQEKSIFQDFNLTINANDKVLIKGTSGKGKSTLINLMMNYLDPTSGTIKINNTLYEQETDLANLFTLVNKDIQLLEYPSLNQIIAAQETNYSVEKINQLKELFNINFIEDETNVDVSNLSEGQVQRIKLASAFYIDKPVFLLDEVLSNLDKENRDDILNKILSLDKTIIFVSHHLTSNQEDLFNKKVIL